MALERGATGGRPQLVNPVLALESPKQGCQWRRWESNPRNVPTVSHRCPHLTPVHGFEVDDRALVLGSIQISHSVRPRLALY